MTALRILAAIVAFAVAPAIVAQVVPREAERWHNRLSREARKAWGPDAPVATFAAQIQQESGWNPDARSLVGAQGMAQFMPATASWIADAYPELADGGPLNPVWAIRALVTYDRHIWDRTSASTTCDRMAKTLAGYNGGAGWTTKDEALAKLRGLDPARWWGNVETVNAGRSPAAWAENRGYPRRILRTLEQHYVDDAWLGASCEG